MSAILRDLAAALFCFVLIVWFVGAVIVGLVLIASVLNG